MPNNTGEFAARVAALRARLDGAQVRLAEVAKQQNGLLEGLARNELEQQKERIGTYQIQARFALASIYDRAAAPTPAPAPHEPKGDTQEAKPGEPTEEAPAPLDNAPPPRAEEPAPDNAAPATDTTPQTPPADSAPPEAPK